MILAGPSLDHWNRQIDDAVIAIPAGPSAAPEQFQHKDAAKCEAVRDWFAKLRQLQVYCKIFNNQHSLRLGCID